MERYEIQIIERKSDLASIASDLIIKFIRSFLAKKTRVQIAIPGGSTPSDVYKLLSKADIPWNRVDVFLGDERWVDINSSSSNALMVRNTLMSNYPGSEACFHYVPTTELTSPEASAEVFEKLLKQVCVGHPPVFDLMLLGLGEDGHTASLFPFSESLYVVDKLTTIGRGKGQERITLTHPVLSASDHVVFLVSGSSKKVALKRLIDPSEPSDRTPAKLVRPLNKVLILADKDASSLI